MCQDEAQLVRLAEGDRPPVFFSLDGTPTRALEGDTVLTAILTARRTLRVSDFSGEPRAGFCLIGACQDCWVRTEDGRRLRACTTAIETGMRLLTHAPDTQRTPTQAAR
ncbi:(2Fe-2S)-binding protein [Trinickia sp. NRRL B-1857]|uniref:(2Fe-2S)-binding protein n=1 Tax=Trinickia sp. NRRL B-1857 TaxID=3162879 RepID=UPI003D2AE99C